MNWILLPLVSSALAVGSNAQTGQIGWPVYGGDPGGTRYSALTSSNTANVADLELAWTYRTGELGQNADDCNDMTFESTPIFIEGGSIIHIFHVRWHDQ